MYCGERAGYLGAVPVVPLLATRQVERRTLFTTLARFYFAALLWIIKSSFRLLGNVQGGYICVRSTCWLVNTYSRVLNNLTHIVEAKIMLQESHITLHIFAKLNWFCTSMLTRI